MSVVASSDAYAKALLHCYKHPTQAVCGMLVGKRISKGAGDHGCYVIDAVPLSHALPMTAPHPMLEVAYAHVQSAAKTKGLSILGLYIANERVDDHSISALMRPVLEAVQARMGSDAKLLVWMLDNASLTTPPTALAVTSSFYSASLAERPLPLPAQVPAAERLTFGRWNSDTLTPEATVSEEAVVEVVGNALDAFAQYRIVDFEDHLENPQLNYLEQPLSALTTQRGK